MDHLNCLPQGELKIYHKTAKGKAYPYFIYQKPNGKRLYIKKNKALLEKLALKAFLKEEMKRIEELLFLSNSAAEATERFTISSIMNDLPKELLPYITMDQGRNSVKTKESLEKKRLSEWKNEPYSANPYDAGKRMHRTSDGTWVKSKSELIIYEKLLQYNITFRYEAPLKIGNSYFYPDFTIMLPDGRIIYWEHAGMMDLPVYRLRHKEKLEQYESAGIVPWKNLIITYDDENGNLDLQIVESEIRNKLLC